jgi:xanthine dehydrogenase molybdopterin-binding subunit B
MERLQPFRDANPSGSFADHVRAALFDRVSLSAYGYYKVRAVSGGAGASSLLW